jgi:hypothetical protein
MGFLARLFGRAQEEPIAPPEPEPEPEPIGAGQAPPAVEPERAPEPEPEPEPVGVGFVPPAVSVEPEPEPEPQETGPPSELSMTLEEATAALRAAGSDGVRIGFLSREYRRASEEDGAAARRRLVKVLTEELRARGLLTEDGSFELLA